MTERLVATIAFLFLVFGVASRKRTKVHVPLMLAGIGIDTTLVIALQIQRNVIQDAMTQNYSFLESSHILSSSIAFALYFPTVFLGARQFLGKGSPAGRSWHIRIALAAFAFRATGFLLMFSF